MPRAAAEWEIFMSCIVIDLILLAVLLAFALHGLRRGLILSLFSLLSVLVALVGAVLLSNLWSPALSQWLQPVLQPTVSSAVESALPERLNGTDSILGLLEDAELPFGLGNYLPEAAEPVPEDAEENTWVTELADFLTEKLADSIAKNGLFLVCFLLILLVWKLLARTLNLVAALPGLHALNRLGGFVFGVLRGALVLFLLAWLVRWLFPDRIPAEAVEQSTLLRFFLTAQPTQFLGMLKR